MIIDGSGIPMGRLASYVAKELLKGEDVSIVNCNEVIMTGNRKKIESDFRQKRSRFGSSQKGPKIQKSSERIVKRSIRGMLPDHREGRGRIAWKNLKCYNEIPKELVSEQVQDSSAKRSEQKDQEIKTLKKDKKIKSLKIKDIRR